MGLSVFDKIITFFFGLMIFFLPISKAVIEFSAVVCIITWFLKQVFIFTSGRKAIPLKSAANMLFGDFSLGGALTLFFLANILAVVFSSNMKLSVNALIFKLSEYILIFIIAKDSIRSKSQCKFIIYAFLSSLFFISLDGFFQAIFKYDLFRHRKLFQGRVTASFINPNDLGSYLITAIPLALSLAFSGLGKKIKTALAVLAISAVSILMFTLSKGAWLAFLLALLFWGRFSRKRYLLYVLAGILAIGFALPVFFKFSSFDLIKRMMLFSNDVGAMDRKFLWQAAIRMFIDKPAFGVGLGTFMENYPKFWLRPTTEIAYTHNCYLQTLAETGIFGLLTFLLFLYIWLKNTLQILAKPEKSFFYFSLLGLTVGLIAYLLNSFVDTNFYSLPIAVLFWFILGLQQAVSRIIKDEEKV
ncbi:MAG: hypothetical protein COV72_03335 [Candidatus Omnitrophica bacterium CG11_big_fil_rev_8_21_14_0_20_42_13]|uniref:O-antigen ligase-related domain-containing protein n=1 Tax=Candidatus Ghiorseimicrobium undicola TaxID=1974746 RepID=A0A2H0LYB6_9BACT|nr:MAG: hypothetical protein COV72_03335 [Candidatus Omnitrophica bacterium CG11_big_fil_rev_8_21_14_0_20_42_13]